jgi:hypothetical protein
MRNLLVCLAVAVSVAVIVTITALGRRGADPHIAGPPSKV